MAQAPDDIRSALRVRVLIYLHEHGPTGGEVLRKAIQKLYLRPGVVFGRQFFNQIMVDLILAKQVRCDEKNGRRTFTCLVDVIY